MDVQDEIKNLACGDDKSTDEDSPQIWVNDFFDVNTAP